MVRDVDDGRRKGSADSGKRDCFGLSLENFPDAGGFGERADDPGFPGFAGLSAFAKVGHDDVIVPTAFPLDLSLGCEHRYSLREPKAAK